MKEYEIAFKTCNSENYPKRITVYIAKPDKMDKNTRVMHFAHGWGEKMVNINNNYRSF